MKKEGDNQVQMTCTEIKSCARQFLNVALVDKDFHMIVFKISQTLSLFRSMWQLRCQQDLMRKYPYYDQPPYLEGRPYLLDAVCSGCPFTFTPHTFEAFTSDVEKDIETLFNLPRRECQIHERVMMARRISVLGAACINPHVSLDLVKLILYKDDETFDCRIWCFLPWEYPSEGDALLKDVESLRSYLDWERFEAIHALFTEFVAYAVARDEGSDSNYHEYEEEGDFGGHFRSRD
jgi:hypothetical protein